MKDNTAAQPAKDTAYVAPAIERRESTKGVLGPRTTKGSYCPPGVPL